MHEHIIITLHIKSYIYIYILSYFQRCRQLSAYWSLCKMIQENDWKGVEDFVGDHPEALTAEISYTMTIFHHIIKFIRHDVEGAACLIDKLASKVDPRILEQKSHPGMTVLSLCAILGNTSVSKVLVKYCRNLPNVRSNDNWLPVHNAAVYGHKDTVKYLVQVTAEENLLGSDGAALISCLVRSKLYGQYVHIMIKLNLILLMQHINRSLKFEDKQYKNRHRTVSQQKLIYEGT